MGFRLWRRETRLALLQRFRPVTPRPSSPRRRGSSPCPRHFRFMPWIPACGPVDLVAGGYRLVGTASASPCGELTISQLPPPARVPNVAQPPPAVRPTGLKPPRNARMAAIWAMHQGPAWARRWSLPAPQPFGDSGPSTAHRAAVPHCPRRYGYYQVVGNWRPSMSKSTGPCAGMTIGGVRGANPSSSGIRKPGLARSAKSLGVSSRTRDGQASRGRFDRLTSHGAKCN